MGPADPSPDLHHPPPPHKTGPESDDYGREAGFDDEHTLYEMTMMMMIDDGNDVPETVMQ